VLCPPNSGVHVDIPFVVSLSNHERNSFAIGSAYRMIRLSRPARAGHINAFMLINYAI
jgi:hypothetical protein